MGITLNLYPFDNEKQEYSNEPVLFTFGEMTAEYYNKISTASIGLPEHSDYGYYTDNVVSRGSNIFGTLTGDTLNDFEITPSDFIGPEESRYKRIINEFKVTDDLRCRVFTNVSLWGTYDGDNNNGKSYITLSCAVEFYSIKWGDYFGFHHSGDFTIGNKTYTEYMTMTKGFNPFNWLANNGYYFGLNAYPNTVEAVEKSKTTTGCLIQAFTLFPDDIGVDRARQQGLYVYGIRGDVVKPYNDTDGTKKYIPYILSAGYVPEFPENESDIIVGDYNNNSDEGAIPPTPEQSAIRSGMVRMYQMTTSQLTAFSNFLWNTDLTEWDNFVNTLKQWFSNPLDSIISLTISPVDIFHNYKTNVTSRPEESNIKLGGFDTGVKGYVCYNNYIQIPLGRLSLKPYYKSFLDCNPHSSFSIYLPYIGFKELEADVLFSKGGTAIEVVYNVDVMTGVCVANILIEKESNGTKLKHVIYSFAGNMNTTIPISSANMRDFISACISAGASALAIAGTGGASSTLVAAGLAAQQGMNIASQKVNISHSGGMSLEAGMFGIQYAYLVVTRPREARPSNYKNINGIPSELGGQLGNYSGFTKVSSVQVNISGATEEEKNEIEKLLKEGVIL